MPGRKPTRTGWDLYALDQIQGCSPSLCFTNCTVYVSSTTPSPEQRSLTSHTASNTYATLYFVQPTLHSSQATSLSGTSRGSALERRTCAEIGLRFTTGWSGAGPSGSRRGRTWASEQNETGEKQRRFVGAWQRGTAQVVLNAGGL